MRIVLVRHGQTVWNEKRIFRGRADIPLDATGLRQAHAAAQRLEDIPVEAVYSSPLQRSWETARIIALKKGVKPEMDSDLMDIDFGDWEGLSLEEVQEKFPQHYNAWLNTPHTTAIPNGDDLNTVSRRVSALLDRLTHSGYASIVLVSHRVVLKVLMCVTLGRDLSCFWDIKQDLASISVLDHKDGMFSLSLANDTSHLAENSPPQQAEDF